ncbi:hypothetical protein M413DRAFT_442452 [Hebeloma cylindrosporum]|uniref:Uncharacterized protein n=1 Tax=Hebeloma cylindrosporum TaxID=76867 RepID=A0A0C3CK37_HEBCY|nr:hypothetical protein M413DRAFT_442452 [Hebeloma cylindrosporum h7]
MAFKLPFNVSDIILTPKRVRIPGEIPKSPSSPSKTRTRTRSAASQWSTDLSVTARSLRTLVAGKNPSAPRATA